MLETNHEITIANRMTERKCFLFVVWQALHTILKQVITGYWWFDTPSIAALSSIVTLMNLATTSIFILI